MQSLKVQSYLKYRFYVLCSKINPIYIYSYFHLQQYTGLSCKIRIYSNPLATYINQNYSNKQTAAILTDAEFQYPYILTHIFYIYIRQLFISSTKPTDDLFPSKQNFMKKLLYRLVSSNILPEKKKKKSSKFILSYMTPNVQRCDHERKKDIMIKTNYFPRIHIAIRGWYETLHPLLGLRYRQERGNHIWDIWAKA